MDICIRIWPVQFTIAIDYLFKITNDLQLMQGSFLQTAYHCSLRHDNLHSGSLQTGTPAELYILNPGWLQLDLLNVYADGSASS